MYGYRIIDGKAVIAETEAGVIRAIFNGYISGMGLREASKTTGKEMVHSSVKRIIRNTCYVGDDFYPAIISRHTFSKANAELMRRAEKNTKKKRLKPPPVYSEFSFIQPDKHFDDPVQQAEYMYSLIEVKI